MSYTPYGEAAKPPAKQLNPEELQHLLGKLSSDEMKELQEALKSCTTEVTMTRGVPITAALLGSLYFARTRLPAQYHFGPKGWPFYAILGIGSLTVSNLFFINTCKERVQPRIDELWAKYQSKDDKKMSYEYLRQQHRAGEPIGQEGQNESGSDSYTTHDQLRHHYRGEVQSQEQRQPDSFIYNQPSSYGSQESSEDDSIAFRRPIYRPDPYAQEPSFVMSGTPSGPSRPRDF